jgi:hypothetical protein
MSRSGFLIVPSFTLPIDVNTDVTRRRLEPVLVCGNPEADARQDGEAVTGIAYREFQHGNFLLSWFLVWRMKESTLMRNVCR